MAKPQLKTITATDLKNLQIDEKRQLYWYGQRVRSQITLTWPQTDVAVIGALAGIATIVNGFASGLNSAATIACARGAAFPVIGCPIQPATPPVITTSPAAPTPH